MKILKTAAVAVLALGLTSAVYAEMGGHDMHMKSGMNMQGKMNMAGDFDTQKSMMLKRLNKMTNCVESSKNTEDIQSCKKEMMQNMKKMKNSEAMKSETKSMKCAAGKCGGK